LKERLDLMRIGPTELLMIAGLVVLLFGGKKLPELARGLGQGLKEFKTAVREKPEETDEPAKKLA
jgi:sec-independent protein translocase protein TatA